MLIQRKLMRTKQQGDHWFHCHRHGRQRRRSSTWHWRSGRTPRPTWRERWYSLTAPHLPRPLLLPPARLPYQSVSSWAPVTRVRRRKGSSSLASVSEGLSAFLSMPASMWSWLWADLTSRSSTMPLRTCTLCQVSHWTILYPGLLLKTHICS